MDSHTHCSSLNLTKLNCNLHVHPFRAGCAWSVCQKTIDVSGRVSVVRSEAAVRRGLTGRQVTLDLDGGRIWIDWQGEGVWMTGPTAHVYDGVLFPQAL